MDELMYGAEYFCYFRGEFIGTATFTDDPCIGDTFLKMEVHASRGLEEIAIMPDEWKLRIEQDC
ncbi:MAG: hypothetical protein ABIR19_09030 [Ginsengibacter sp.]